MRSIVNICAYMCLLIFASCTPAFEPVEYGKDACANCKMTIVDKRYAAELLTSKGRAYKFDDILCMKQYVVQLNEKEENTQFFIADYINNSEQMLDAKDAVYLQHESFASPMNGNVAAFASADDAQRYKDNLNIELKDWNNTLNR